MKWPKKTSAFCSRFAARLIDIPKDGHIFRRRNKARAAVLAGLLAFSQAGIAYALELRAVDQPSSAGDNKACASCHSDIYRSYLKTPMAHASGPAAENFIPADVTHAKSGVHYRIYKEENRVWLSFDRPGDPSVRGKRELLYYIGSGHRGLTYLFSTDSFVFESPVNWYGKKRIWDMTPAYQDAKEIPLNLPAFTSCLHCHVSEMRPPVAGTENRYVLPLFGHGGVSCERCHGPGAAHIKSGPIVNPAKLPPDRRDQVCMQCHLEGKVAIERPGRHVYDYRPGENLSDYIRYYVFQTNSGPGAVSQVEALAQSTCKKKTGDAMSCTSCHDPHFSPSAEERVSYYRGKCLACHGAAFGSKHHAEQPDCTGCHMPSSQSTDVAHTQVTDHRIPRRPDISPQLLQDVDPRSAKPRLIAFPPSLGSDHDVRDLALAWQSLAQRGMSSAAGEAERLLHLAAKQTPDDPALLAALGYIEQKRGATDRARELYQKAIALDPSSIDVATNLGVIEASTGHLREALKLWEGAFQRAPGRSTIGMNLARTFCDAGQFDESRSFVLRVLEFNPDLGGAKKLLQQLNRTPPRCTP
ncbi:MAG TPA: multiheme c-type cytochrome [Terriglobales bacterium]|nr:multiheme c-type cytochrome [Terriglobales bacterium]